MSSARQDSSNTLDTDYDGNAMFDLLSIYGRDERTELIIGTLAGIISRSTELVPAYILGVTIDAVFFDTHPFNLPLLPKTWVPTGRIEQLSIAIVLVGCAYVIGSVFSWISNWAWNHVSQHVQHAVRTDAYDAMQDLELAFFEEQQTGEIMSVLNNDVNRLEKFITDRLKSGTRIVIRVGGMGIVMLLLNWQLAMLPLIVIPVLGITSYKFIGVIQPKYQDVRSTVGTLNSRLENNIGGIEVIKAYTKETFESERVKAASREYLDANWDAIETRIKFFPTLRLITAIGFVATFLLGGIWVINGPPWFFTLSLTAGTLVTFLLYTRRFMWPMRQFGQIINEYQYAQAACARIMYLLNHPSSLTEQRGEIVLDNIDGGVTYENVWFRYSRDEWTLQNLDFDINPGELVGIVGPTGAGKTTMIKLLLRLYDIDRGTIRIDGTDIRDVTLRSLRDSISYVSQEPYLFQGTIRENIAYGKPNTPDEQIRRAAKSAGAESFITELPDEYDSVVGERGIRLSGGQRQRISIARALLRDPEILIFDEATSHVDNETEAIIQKSLLDLGGERTIFVVAHQLSSVKNADTILVLDDGELIEQGSHEELLKKDGLYANLWKIQVGEVDELPSQFVEHVTR